MFKRMLDIPYLRVYEDSRIWKYARSYSKDGFPYYVAPEEKSQLHKTVLMDDVLFLPIEHDTFLHDRKNYFYGYRYLIASPGHTTVSFLDQFPVEPKTELRLGFEVCRVRYFMDDDKSFDICIDYMGDALFPTRTITIDYPTEKIHTVANDVVKEIINAHCQWYADRRL